MSSPTKWQTKPRGRARPTIDSVEPPPQDDGGAATSVSFSMFVRPPPEVHTPEVSSHAQQ